MVDIWLPYGNTEVCVRVPTENLLDVIEPKERAGAENPQAEIEKALMNPIGTKRLTETVKPGDKVVIVLKDSGALTNQLMVSSILKELNSAGTKDEDLAVIVAYNPLRSYAAKMAEPLLSEDISSRIRIICHNCETSEHVKVGETSRGTKVYLNKAFTEAKVKISVGVIEPHLYAGYSGGRDGVLPGISNIETVQRNSSLSLNPKATRGSLEGNPVHEDMIEAAHLAGVDFTLNVVRNSKLEVVNAFAGDINEAFDEGVKLVDTMYKVPTEKRADVVCIGSGGSPFDVNLFEACRSIDGALEATRRGGVIVLVAECPEGYGNREFYEFMSRFKDPDALEKNLKKKFSIGGFMAYRLLRALQRTKIFLVSIMPDYYALEPFRMNTARTANEALRYAFNVVGKKGKISVIPYGNLTIPLIKSSEVRSEIERR